MIHEVADVIHLVLLVGTVAVMVEYTSSKVLVRICPLLSIFPVVLAWARVLRNYWKLEFLVSNHAIIHVAIVHGAAMTEVWSHWELIGVIIDQVCATLIHALLLLLHSAHVPSVLPCILLLLSLIRATRGLSYHWVRRNVISRLRLLVVLEQLLGYITVLGYFLYFAARELFGIRAAKIISFRQRWLEFNWWTRLFRHWSFL